MFHSLNEDEPAKTKLREKILWEPLFYFYILTGW